MGFAVHKSDVSGFSVSVRKPYRHAEQENQMTSVTF